jgi:hypothetical protein
LWVGLPEKRRLDIEAFADFAHTPASVVDQSVNASPAFQASLGHQLAVAPVGDIGLHGKSLLPLARSQRAGQLLQVRRRRLEFLAGPSPCD